MTYPVQSLTSIHDHLRSNSILNLSTLSLQFHPEWALGDPFWVFGGDDSTSQVAFSALLWAMQETKTIAVVRMLLPKLTQPRVALLIPKVGEDAVDERMEMGLLVPVGPSCLICSQDCTSS